MGMLGHAEVPAETINPIRRLAGGVSRLLAVFAFSTSMLPVFTLIPNGIFTFLRLTGDVENRRVEAAVERDVGLDEKVIGKEAAAIAQTHFQRTVRLGAGCPT